MADNNDEVVPALESDELETDIAGPWAVYKGVNETVSEDLARAETLSLPLVVILSLLIFGSVVAALMPAVVGAIAVLGALAVVRLITGFTEVSVFSINVITLLGTGLAIDYALFMISRFREELAAAAGGRPGRVREGDPRDDGDGRPHGAVLRAHRRRGDVLAADLPAELPALPRVRRHRGRPRRAWSPRLTVLPAILLLLGRRIDAGRLPWRRHRPVWSTTTTAPGHASRTA